MNIPPPLTPPHKGEGETETSAQNSVPAHVPSEAVFCEAWEAQAFALAVALQDAGVFTAAEWAEALGAEVHSDGAASDGHDYYRHWLAALEKLLAAKGVASSASVDRLAAAWERAAHATPHGQPIRLENDPMGRDPVR